MLRCTTRSSPTANSEDTLDWFAQDKDGNVWYFGEDSAELVNGRVSSLGAPGQAEWMAPAPAL